MKTKVFEQFLNIISKYQLCEECLGRQFALLGTGLTNTERSNSLFKSIILEYNYEIKFQDSSNPDVQEELVKNKNNLSNLKKNANFDIIDNNLKYMNIKPTSSNQEFTCFLCNNYFLKIEEIIQRIKEEIEKYEYNTFHVGSIIDARILDREDEFRSRLNISTGESFKRNLNRVIGIILSDTLHKEVDFKRPDLVVNIEINFDDFKILIYPNPLCIKGNYHKYERGIPQTHWPHRNCNGKGCKECNFTGKQYPTSVEELLAPFFQRYAKGDSVKFHGAGREDIDAKCLGNGRPFILEIKNPIKRSLPLKKIEQEIMEKVGNRVDAINLEIVDRTEIPKLKDVGEKTRKSYSALCESESELSEVDFIKKLNEAKKILIDNIIYQRTPIRVVHRRADKTREKKLYKLEGNWIDPTHFRFNVTVMGGTYVKELISGDSNRTSPSISGIFGAQIVCKELDVSKINC